MVILLEMGPCSINGPASSLCECYLGLTAMPVGIVGICNSGTTFFLGTGFASTLFTTTVCGFTTTGIGFSTGLNSSAFSSLKRLMNSSSYNLDRSFNARSLNCQGRFFICASSSSLFDWYPGAGSYIVPIWMRERGLTLADWTMGEVGVVSGIAGVSAVVWDGRGGGGGGGGGGAWGAQS
ncbi:hypothetical protein FGO68_gene17345 [Halteria grandinella]|uniref:Uncharacterized protein n=1 Tax=Halteria grandinella TaxID=5974 RepID=A0A8J8T8P4_HALGN|nr:hypothetical protein FGO68_gene17345 [Halteria grandinella]